MTSRWLALFFLATLIVPLGATSASAGPARRATKARAQRKVVAAKVKKLPARRRSMFGGKGTAPLAFFVCRDHMGAIGKTPAIAQRRCEKANPDDKQTCRCMGRDAIAVYGPFKYPKPKKEAWYSNAEYPYEATNGAQYSRDGYVPTP